MVSKWSFNPYISDGFAGLVGQSLALTLITIAVVCTVTTGQKFFVEYWIDMNVLMREPVGSVEHTPEIVVV